MLSFFHNTYVNLVSFIAANFILILCLYGRNAASAFFHTLTLTILMLLAELLTGSLLDIIGSGSVYASYPVADMSDFIMFIYAVINKFAYFIFILCITRFYKKDGETDVIWDKKSSLLTTIPFLSLFIMIALFFIASGFSLSRQAAYMIAAALICILAINVIAVWLLEYTREQQRRLHRLSLEIQMEQDAAHYNKIMEVWDEEQKILIHDIKNHLQTVQTLCQTDNTDDARRYIDHLLNSSVLHSPLVFSNNQHLNLLLGRYAALCEKNSVALHVDAQNSNLDFMLPEDITSLICNIMDNAVEASRGLPDAVIDAKLTDKKEAGITIISVVNSCRTNPVMDKNNHFITRKSDKKRHGVGIRSIQRMTEKYNGELQTYYSVDDHTFHTIVLLKNDMRQPELILRKEGIMK